MHGLVVALAQLLTCYVGLKVLCSRALSFLPRPTVRKLLHIINGPIHIFFWTLFDPADSMSRIYSIITPALLTGRIAAIYLLEWDESAIRQGMSRSGDSEELIYGPTLYGAVHILVTLVQYRSNAAHVVVLVLCLGDGMAALVGQQWGPGNELPWNTQKSFAGSVAFFICSLASVWLWLGIAPMATVLVATLVESLMSSKWDNLYVPIVTYIAFQVLGY